VNSFVALAPQKNIMQSAGEAATDAFLAVVDDEMDLAIHVATGRFADKPKLSQCLDEPRLKAIQEVMQQERTLILDDFSVAPLSVGQVTLGVIFLDQSVVQPQDLELLHIFANQAAVAIQNTRLYEMATIDSLTGVFVRRYFEKWVVRELRSMLRLNAPLSMLMIDMDGLKRINDSGGHPAGDQALTTLGSALRNATRTVDLAARYGGDEFVVALPQTPIENAHLVGQRILDLLEGRVIEAPGGPYQVRASIGIAGIGSHDFSAEDIPRPISQQYLEDMCEALIDAADQELYQAKRDSGLRLKVGRNIDWKPFHSD